MTRLQDIIDAYSQHPIHPTEAAERDDEDDEDDEDDNNSESDDEPIHEGDVAAHLRVTAEEIADRPGVGILCYNLRFVRGFSIL